MKLSAAELQEETVRRLELVAKPAEPLRTTTGPELRDALLASIRVRGVDAGLTLGTLFDAMLALASGNLNARVASVEFGIMQNGSGRICCEICADGELEFREVPYGR